MTARIKRPPKQRGPKPMQPTDEQRGFVRGATFAGLPQPQIAVRMGISEDSLQRHFRSELDAGKDELCGDLKLTAFQMATGNGDWTKAVPSMTIFVCKTQLGWRDVSAMEHSGPNGLPILTADVTDEVRARALAAFIAKTKVVQD